MIESAATPSHQPGLRLFLAVPLPAAIREQVGELSRRLQKGFQFTACRPAWARLETMHLTLVFLGQRPADLTDSIGMAARAAAAAFAPLRLEVKGLGVFPNWRHPRVLWAGLRDRSHQLALLHKALENSLQPLGYRPESREYHPHLTLARFGSLRGVSAAEAVVRDHTDFKFGPFEAGEIILYQSTLLPSGAEHTPLAAIPLAAGDGSPAEAAP